MKLVVCPLDDVERQARRHRPAAVISLLSPDQAYSALPGDPPRLVLRFHDIAAPRETLVAPDREMVIRLLTFAAVFKPDATLLVHCWMGISRSPAAAFILACGQEPSRPEADIARSLRRASPSASPNPLFVSLADDYLQRQGRMVAALAHIGRGRDAQRGRPFVLETPKAAP
jgi:predicted protein tyrosine phosphatase